jgi:hypothetical protein
VLQIVFMCQKIMQTWDREACEGTGIAVVGETLSSDPPKCERIFKLRQVVGTAAVPGNPS